MIVGLIYLLCGLALWHFIIQAIVVPSARATIRLRLFALRDQLRRLSTEGLVGEKEFEEAQRRINNLIRIAPSLDPFMIAEWDLKVKTDKELAQRLERRQAEFESMASKEVKALIENACKVGAVAVRINSLSWVIYIIPIAIGVIVLSSLVQKVLNMTGATERELPSSTLCPA